MRTDSIWYKLFQQFPSFFFELIGQPPSTSKRYRFDSVEIKELSFRIDGVFLPTDNNPNTPTHFVEVQFQKNDNLYYRLFTELFLYINQEKEGLKDWQATVIYPRGSIEGERPIFYTDLFRGKRVQIIYLDEMPRQPDPTIGIGTVQLITASEKEAGTQAKQLIEKARSEISDTYTQRDW